MPSIFSKIQSRIEIYRLEKRYTRNRQQRSTFMSNAMYVDGEYIHQTPTHTGDSSASSSATSSPIDEERGYSLDLPRPNIPAARLEELGPHTPIQKKAKKLRRFSSMPGFRSSSYKMSSPTDSRQKSVDERDVW